MKTLDALHEADLVPQDAYEQLRATATNFAMGVGVLEQEVAIGEADQIKNRIDHTRTAESALTTQIAEMESGGEFTATTSQALMNAVEADTFEKAARSTELLTGVDMTADAAATASNDIGINPSAAYNNMPKTF